MLRIRNEMKRITFCVSINESKLRKVTSAWNAHAQFHIFICINSEQCKMNCMINALLISQQNKYNRYLYTIINERCTSKNAHCFLNLNFNWPIACHETDTIKYLYLVVYRFRSRNRIYNSIHKTMQSWFSFRDTHKRV